MIDRRQFVTTAAWMAAGSSLAVGISLAVGPLSAAAAASGTAHSLYTPELFLLDSRCGPACAQLLTQQAAGTEVVAFEGDLLGLWYSRLQPYWQRQPMVLAGLTTSYALFVLETLAADHRMKLLYSESVATTATGDAMYQWLIVPRATAA